MLEIDGSYGEGGGQIIRTAVALSAFTKKTIKIKNIRAKRKNPGLSYQHITAIKLIGKICDAEVIGLEKGSLFIEFHPKEIKGGDYDFDVGTAGSVTLILQACILPCLFAKEKTLITITGGTDVRWSPPIDYFINVFIPILKKMGINIEVDLIQRGHYPKGGGKVRVEISQISNSILPLTLDEFIKIIKIFGIAHNANLPNNIVERMKNSVIEKLRGFDYDIKTEICNSFSSGTGIVLWAESPNSILGASSLGERGVRAEIVGERAINELLQEIKSKSTIDSHMADQILPYLSLSNQDSCFLTKEISLHAKTNMWLIQQFLDMEFEVIDNKINKKVIVKVKKLDK